MAASVSTVALADVTPPASVWKAAADGGYEHVLTGLQCPATLGRYHRRDVHVFDDFGLDVGCDYAGQTSGLTYYLTRRDAPGLDQAMAEARRELEQFGGARHPQFVSETTSNDDGLAWTIAAYADDGGLRDAIWIADLSGWTLEYRATYAADEEARVSGEIKTFAAAVRASAGARLAVCAKAAPAERHATPVTDRSEIESAAMMTSLLGGALQSAAANKPSDALPAPTLCVEHTGRYAKVPLVFWRSIAPDGSDRLLDEVTTVSSGAPVTVSFATGGLSGLMSGLGEGKADKPPQWTATFDQKGQTLIFGYFSGRPSIDQMGELVAGMLSGAAKPVGGYGVKGKDITILMPEK
jgi:hypothetical protein